MSTIAGERGFGGEEGAAFWQRGLDRLLAAELHLSLEAWLYIGLVLLAAVLRFTDLGARALHHDESLHATYSWYFATGKGYTHDPLMHGPLLFHMTALVYLLFGASDATSRFAPALFGTALVLVPLLLRPWLGRVGALTGAVFIAFSPSVLYYSRFVRNESWVAFFTLMLVVCLMRFRASQRERWLYLAAATLMLEFVSKETAFIIAAIVLLYLNGCVGADLARQLAPAGEDGERDTNLARIGIFIAVLPVAWLFVCVWPLIDEWRERNGLREFPADAPMLLVLGLLAAPQYSAAIRVILQKLPLVHYDITQPGTVGILGYLFTRTEAVGAVTVLGLLALTLIVGWWWDPRRWFVAAAIFYIPYFLLFTTFITNRDGWTSGIWGALSYWLDQQGVQRGTQPVFYYGLTLSVYEYLTLGLAAAGLLIHAIRRGIDNTLFLLVAAALIPVIAMVDGGIGHLVAGTLVACAIACATIAMRGDPLRQFLLFYFGALFFGLSVSGEKMPWLTVHLALPLTVLAALAVNDVWGAFLDLAPRPRRYAAAVIAIALVASAGLAYLLAWNAASDGLRVLAALGALAVLIMAGVALTRLLRRAGWLRKGQAPAWAAGAVALAGFIGLFGALTVRADYRLNWIHPDTPDEMLIYTQSSPDIPKVAKKIDRLARESGLGNQLTITVDSNDAFTWPWAWYLRNYPLTGFPDLSVYTSNPSAAAALNPGKVLIVNAQDVAVVTPFAGQYDAGQRLHHRWWFPEGYKTGTSTRSILTRLRNGSELKRWWGYITNRDGYGVTSSDISPRPTPDRSGQPAIVSGSTAQGIEYLGSVDSYVYFPADWTPGKGLSGAANGAGGTAHSNGSTLTIGVFGTQPGQFNRPTDVSLDQSGDLIVADSLNNRIQKFDAQGSVVATATQAGGVTFHEPWGVASDAVGNVYVSDTWNHRIVKLDANLQFVKAWGQLAVGGVPRSPLDLYGPRGIAVAPDGTLWVADTGDGRIVHYDANGNPLGAFGSKGSTPGQFNEPVGIAVATDGTIFVADTWNNRIVVLNQEFKVQNLIQGDQWGWVASAADQTQTNKPFLAALPDGTILATFPGADPVAHPNAVAVVRFDRNGKILFSDRQLPNAASPLREPIGVAADAAGNVAVTDGLLNQVIRLPAAALAGH
ncbi:MAG TPA: flippase activity-associated protein Agl23 [Dehalococcoidia bacterium]|nr:flippase activity-associated protein Agl23 [Dehalococcoidia bacterium]